MSAAASRAGLFDTATIIAAWLLSEFLKSLQFINDRHRSEN